MNPATKRVMTTKRQMIKTTTLPRPLVDDTLMRHLLPAAIRNDRAPSRNE